MRDPSSAAGPTSFVEAYFDRFQFTYQKQDYGTAYEVFEQTLRVAPELAFRQFITRASAAVAQTLQATKKGSDLAAWLDNKIVDYPHINLLCDQDHATINPLVALRE